MQHKIFKVKIFEDTHKSVKSVKVFCLEIFRLYGILMVHNSIISTPSPQPRFAFYAYASIHY